MFENIEDTELLAIFGALILGFTVVRLAISNIKESKETESSSDDGVDLKEEVSHRPWYEVLDVDSNASLADIKLAYKRKISQYHPDKVAALGPELTQLAEAKTREINSAYDKAIKIFKL
jgi:DnaJ-domain-containing protein 1